MTGLKKQTMRDTLIKRIYERMKTDESIFFLSADMGAPVLDALREDFPDRFVNVGIAEQNLINVSTGLAIEGFKVFAYAIAPFITMRCFEQIRTNLSLSARFRDLNVNLVGVGAGVSYDMSGPTHHSVEDISIMRTLPDIGLISPSDWTLAGEFLDYALEAGGPKFLRLDGKPQEAIYTEDTEFDWNKGFHEHGKGAEVCIISTGYMTHKALKAAEELGKEGHGITVIDLFLLKPFNEAALFEAIKSCKSIVTIEEGFIDKGGLDSMILGMLSDRNANIRLTRLGFDDNYIFKGGGRDHLYTQSGFGDDDIMRTLRESMKG
ncbi:MAG: transketolase C-terminal domain-containing protein [Thermodesulfobacteriota bacterium]